LEPKNLKTERYLGMALLEQGEMAEAEKHLKAVVLQGEEDASLYYHLSRIREAAGDRSGAVAYLESALRKDPNYQNARVRLDKLLGRKGP
jgi:predicted Zn-dependent protease